MIDRDDLVKRQAIPRWLSLSQSTSLGELGSRAVKSTNTHRDLKEQAQTYLDKEFEKSRKKWEETKNKINAEELIIYALMANKVNDIQVSFAAESILSSPYSTTSSIDFVRRVTGLMEDKSKNIFIDEGKIRLEISRQKKLLIINPRDSLRMPDIALLYSNIGQNGASRRFIRRAIKLNPNDRHILRASTRFLMHVGENEAASYLLSSSKVSELDPWLKAAYFAVEASLGRPPSGWRRAKSMLASGNFSPRDLSELAVQMGTIEFESGSRRQGLKFMRQGAISPTENAIAQIDWVSRVQNTFNTEDVFIDLSQSHEASAHVAFEKGEWEEALQHCEAWRQLEPFSARAPIFGSFLTSVSGVEFDRGIQLARQGLLANPKNPTLRNNVSVLLAYSSRIDEALSEIEKISLNECTPEDLVTIAATRGLIKFRQENIDEGVMYYKDAMEEAQRLRNSGLIVRALCFLGREIARVDAKSATTLLIQIDEILEKSKKRTPIPKDIKIIRDQIAASIKKIETKISIKIDDIDWNTIKDNAIN